MPSNKAPSSGFLVRSLRVQGYLPPEASEPQPGTPRDPQAQPRARTLICTSKKRGADLLSLCPWASFVFRPRQASELWRRRPFDLVFIDLSSDAANWLSFARSIRSRGRDPGHASAAQTELPRPMVTASDRGPPATTHFRIVFVSDEPDAGFSQTRLQAAEAGADAFLAEGWMKEMVSGSWFRE